MHVVTLFLCQRHIHTVLLPTERETPPFWGQLTCRRTGCLKLISSANQKHVLSVLSGTGARCWCMNLCTFGGLALFIYPSAWITIEYRKCFASQYVFLLLLFFLSQFFAPISQLEANGFSCGFSVWSLNDLSVPAWVSSGFSGFPAHFIDIHIIIGHSARK